MGGIFEGIDEVEESFSAELVKEPEPSRLLRPDEMSDALEERLFKRSMSIVEDTMYFADIRPDENGEFPKIPPPEWVAELGYEGAERRLTVAKAAWMSKKDAPVGLDIAKSIAVGITKARATKSTPRTLNVVAVGMGQPVLNLPSLEIEE